MGDVTEDETMDMGDMISTVKRLKRENEALREALENTLKTTTASQGDAPPLDTIEIYARAGRDVFGCIVALVHHLRALENVTRMTDDLALDRISRLEEKVSAVYAGNSVEHRVLTSEMDRLRAENAELRKANENVQHVAAEYEERIKAMQAQVAQLRRDIAAGGWPAPQPIETAPLGEILTGPEVRNQEDGRGGWVRDWSGDGQTVEEWRLFLKRIGRRWWLPMPPPLPKSSSLER